MHIEMQGCEREVKEADEGDSEDRKNESIMRLSWALVHSRQSEDINRGIAMLEGKCSARNLFLGVLETFLNFLEFIELGRWQIFLPYSFCCQLLG